MIADRMLQLFQGNTDAYGSDEGSCVRRPVTAALIDRHLKGVEGIGIYPIWQGRGRDQDKLMCRWGCADIDTGDWSEAYGLATVLNAMGMPPHVERSRSKGWHVWVFSEYPVEAKTMRRAMKVAYQAIDLPTKEVNPKSELLLPGQLGNYVRLPFKGDLGDLGYRATLDRQVMMKGWNPRDDGRPFMSAEWMSEIGDKDFTTTGALEHWASKYTEPERKEFDGEMISDKTLERLCRNIMINNPKMYEFIKNGPARDRSAGLVSLAHQLKAAGMSPAEIYAVVNIADERWGKYTGRPNRESYLRDIVSRVL